ncbi:MAG TPA: 2-oxoacid:acceptor oxidoreductase family protein [Bacillota bacterium]|nr:2-oxoacid:acceptor oxidoreductase family protein [Bacillota bacterium]HOL08567.1 2-oxoacid:acceptor oxidoreductase family protein [Bacillota bacterium]HPO97819.1 2-oxoacid:acceptor oxidoreductase family protein [Bacillota bacterium]
MTLEAIFAGFGGQGVMLIGQLLAYSGMYEGKNVSWFPAYGPEMRGGTANCSVVVSDDPVGSPVISEPDVLVAMNRPSLEKFEKLLKPGGILFYNTSLIDIKPQRTDIKVIGIPANDIATELGNAKVANMVVMGAILKATGAVDLETVVSVLKKTMTGSKQSLIPLNRTALERGMSLVS